MKSASLAAVFINHWPGDASSQSPDGLPLEQQLSELHAHSQAHWAEFAVGAPTFVQYLASRVSVAPALADSLAALHARDLYLACGCVHGLPAALARFDSAILARVPDCIARVDNSATFADEVSQVLRERLLCAPTGELPGIAKYAGTGQLLNWVRVAAVRAALDLRRNQADRVTASVDELTLEALPQGGTPEAEAIRFHCQKEFKAALAAAFAGLSVEQRNVLRLHLTGRLTGEEIAVRLHIGRATVVRWLARARGYLFRETRRLLHQRLNLKPTEVDSFIRAALSQLDISLTMLLHEQHENREDQPK